MNGDVADQDGLRHALDSMIALESRLEESLARFAAEATGYLEAPAIIGQLRSLVAEQHEALEAHVRGLGEVDVPPIGSPILAAFEVPSETFRGTQGEEAVASLRAFATAFAQAAFGYVVLHTLAHRSFQVATADLADQHRRNYLDAARALHQAVGDVALQELQDAGQTCRCQCPACSSGICLCWHVHVDGEVTGLEAPAERIVVRTPPAQSNAERAGLSRGDTILAVDDRDVRSYQDMLDRMREHQPGESVKLRVRHGTGELEELNLIR